VKLQIGRKELIRVNPDELSIKFGTQTSELDQAALPSLQISPQGTRFARIATGVSFRTNRTVLQRVGFVDAETGEALLLLYFDRPCRLTGTRVLAPTPSRGALTVDYDLKVETAGLVWMTAKQDGQLHKIASVAVAPRPILTIAISRM
jgi:hypothetical protein